MLRAALVILFMVLSTNAFAQLNNPGVTASGNLTPANVILGGAGASQVQDSSHSGIAFANLPRNLFIDPATITWSGATATPSILGLSTSESATGTCTSAQFCPINLINITSDNIAASAQAAALEIIHNFGGTALTAGRTSLLVYGNLTAATGNPSGGSYTAMAIQTQASVNDVGTSGTPLSQIQGANILSRINGGVTSFFKILQGGEVDTEVTGSNTVANKEGWEITQLATDKVAGSVSDMALLIGNQSGAVGWLNGLVFGGGPGNWPFQSGATAIDCLNCGTLTNVINFSSATISGFAYEFPGATLSGTGTHSAVAYLLGSTSTVPTLGMYSSAANELDTAVSSTRVTSVLEVNNGYFGVNSNAAINTGDQFDISGSSTTSARGMTIRNQGNGAATQTTLWFGSGASNSEAGIYLNGASFSGGQGANAFVIENTVAAAPLVIGTGSEVVTIGTTGGLKFSTLPSGTAATFACFTSTGALISSATACP